MGQRGGVLTDELETLCSEWRDSGRNRKEVQALMLERRISRYVLADGTTIEMVDGEARMRKVDR